MPDRWKLVAMVLGAFLAGVLSFGLLAAGGGGGRSEAILDPATTTAPAELPHLDADQDTADPTDPAPDPSDPAPDAADPSDADEDAADPGDPDEDAVDRNAVDQEAAERPASGQPPAGEYFATLPPGAVLPSGQDCAARVRPVPENVPENQPYNATVGGRVADTLLSNFGAVAENDFEARVDGAFTGTTDEIIQWAACKWGFDEDMIRAQAYAESSWYAGKLGDCGEQTVERTGGSGGCASVGLIQVKAATLSSPAHPGVFPGVLDSTALNLDYALAVIRLCFEGKESWLAQVSDGYRADDEWACLGRWFSGAFRDPGALDYISRVQTILAERPWEGPYVGCPTWRESFHCSGIGG